MSDMTNQERQLVEQLADMNEDVNRVKVDEVGLGRCEVPSSHANGARVPVEPEARVDLLDLELQMAEDLRHLCLRPEYFQQRGGGFKSDEDVCQTVFADVGSPLDLEPPYPQYYGSELRCVSKLPSSKTLYF